MLSDLQSVQDGNTYQITEAAATPGIDLIVDFVNVTTFDYVQVLGNYNGGATHSVSIQIYCWDSANWHTWDAMDGIEEITRNHAFWLPCPANYIGTGANDGQVRVRFNHTMAGDVTHNLYLDVVSLYDRDTYWQDLIDALTARIDVLEAENRHTTNVYNEGGSTGVYPEAGSGSGAGVYPGKC